MMPRGDTRFLSENHVSYSSSVLVRVGDMSGYRTPVGSGLSGRWGFGGQVN